MTQDDSLLGDMENYYASLGEDVDRQLRIEATADTPADGILTVADAIINVNLLHTAEDRNKAVELFYSKLDHFGVNLEELRPVLEEESNMLVNSAAGAGKTTALILKLLKMYIEGSMTKVIPVPLVDGSIQNTPVNKKVLVSTFLKSGAVDLRQDMHKWESKLNIRGIDHTGLQFKTIHAEVLDALKSMNVSVEIKESSDESMRSVMERHGVRSMSATNFRGRITNEEISDIRGLLAYYRNLLDDKRYDHQLMSAYALSTSTLDMMNRDLRELRQRSKIYDFEDIQEMLEEVLNGSPALNKPPNVSVQKHIQSRYDIVFVDEAQDMSQLQYSILKWYFYGAERFIVVGDNDQTIYSWRGSDIDIIQKTILSDYHPVIHSLSTNYRCGANILRAVVPSIERNSNRLAKDLKAYNAGGKVNIVYSGTVERLVQGIQEDVTAGRTGAVLGRTNDALLIPAIILELDGKVEFSVGNSVSMSTRLPRSVFGMVDLITKKYTDEFKMFFENFLYYRDKKEATVLASILKTNKQNLYQLDLDDIRYSIPHLYEIIRDLRIARQADPVSAYIYLLRLLSVRGFSGDSQYARKGRELCKFTEMLLMEHPRLSDASIAEIQDMFSHTLPDQLVKRSKYGKGTPIRLTTVHEAKGKEWDSVYIWNNVQGVFPSQIGNRDITEAEFEEERRVHYIAWTRPKQQLTVFTEKGSESPFLLECDLSSPEDVKQINPEDVIHEDSTDTGGKTIFYRPRKPQEDMRTPNEVYYDKYVAAIEDVRHDYSIERVTSYSLVVNYATAMALREQGVQDYTLHPQSEYTPGSVGEKQTRKDALAYLEENDIELGVETYVDYLDSFFSNYADNILEQEI